MFTYLALSASCKAGVQGGCWSEQLAAGQAGLSLVRSSGHFAGAEGCLYTDGAHVGWQGWEW